MELMSSLLFCALVAHLPQALGEIRTSTRDLDIKFNNSMIFRQAPMQKKILLNINGPPLVNMVNNIQLVFLDVHCRKCIDCMERAIKAYKTHYHIIKNRPRTDELHEEVLEDLHEKAIRQKREVEPQTPASVGKTKRSKARRKVNRSVTVTKYNVDGEVYALKVKESNTHPERGYENEVSTCQVYSVRKTFSCDTPEGDSFLRSAKLKVGKKNKKDKNNKQVTTTTVKTMFAIPSFRKRQVDNSQVPENVMPSIEEMY